MVHVSGMNPMLTLHVNMKNPIHFTNPTDITHAFVIGQNGTVVLSTKDLTPGLSGKTSIKPTHIGVFEYHCKYHPDTMNGILNVVP
ncbi:MAG: cupredoxin domain-containing protein [Nitrosarchaeum sp.]